IYKYNLLFLYIDGPNLEAGALLRITLENEALKMISIECQIEANPTPSYVWYDMSNNNINISTGMMSYYGHQNPYGQQYPLQPSSNIPTTGLSVFGTTRQVQRIYQNPGQYAMQCQAQSRGKTIKQEFFITVIRKLFFSLENYLSQRNFSKYIISLLNSTLNHPSKFSFSQSYTV
ncbi:unnamed protein product, partial [Rotaria sp. Silwood1]